MPCVNRILPEDDDGAVKMTSCTSLYSLLQCSDDLLAGSSAETNESVVVIQRGRDRDKAWLDRVYLKQLLGFGQSRMRLE